MAKAKSNILTTQTASFSELIGNGKMYRVPAFQRDYSWEMENWEDIWNDILELRRRPDDRHYMGAVVVLGGDRESLIIDGQQRLATLSVLVLAVIKTLDDLANNGKDSEKNRERAQLLRDRFIGEKDAASLTESSKLILNETDDGFYQDYLVPLREPQNSRKLPKSNRLLWECYQFFRREISNNHKIASDGVALTELISETVARQLSFIVISVDDQLNAYTVFETLNARGLELSSTDLLKNYLFSRVKTPADLKALQRRWRSLIDTVRQEHFPEFLRYHLLCKHPKIRSRRLFKLVRDEVKTPKDVFALLDALEKRAELFAALSDATHEYWIDEPACKPYVQQLVLFRVRQMTPLLFAAWEQFSKQDFARVLKLVSVLSFRYSVVSSLNTNELEPLYHSAAKAVLDSDAKTPAQVFERLKSAYVDDEKFEQDFARLTIDTSGQRKRLVKYVLSVLETDLRKQEVSYETDPATIEHILPENPSDIWGESFPQEHWDTFVYRLGNLTLFESAKNRRVSNSDFTEKLGEYTTSGYSLTKDIPKFAPTEWTISLLEARQSKLAKRAVHLWRADYS